MSKIEILHSTRHTQKITNPFYNPCKNPPKALFTTSETELSKRLEARPSEHISVPGDVCPISFLLVKGSRSRIQDASPFKALASFWGSELLTPEIDLHRACPQGFPEARNPAIDSHSLGQCADMAPFRLSHGQNAKVKCWENVTLKRSRTTCCCCK